MRPSISKMQALRKTEVVGGKKEDTRDNCKSKGVLSAAREVDRLGAAGCPVLLFEKTKNFACLQ